MISRIDLPTALLEDGVLHVIRHELKTWPDQFNEIRIGWKLHEFRKNDRDFKTEDLVLLREFEPIPGRYTGEQELVQILSISYGPEWGIPDGFCVWSLRRLEPLKIVLPQKQ